MHRLLPAAMLGVVGLLAAAEPADETKLAELRKKPITTAKGELGDLLTKWWKEGTAAGNVGDWYDNRDRAHSDLNMAPYPQLQRFIYSEDDLKFRRDWALTVYTRPHVTFGNSSTSAPATMGGSNPRHAYCSPKGLELLAQQYRGNNVYIYPEHRDHDPGHNNKGDGYGDTYPTNTPYLFISQGSSGSDQPFMQAIPFTLAAFRPEVKRKLIDTGLLMPTIQMILRSTSKRLTNPKEYLTGKAHPTVFEGSWVDALKMVKMAHEITAETIPPMAQLKVVEEDTPQNGRDYFEPDGVTEKLGDTQAVIARIWRGAAGNRRMVVSAADSFDVNKKPLTFTWVVLRGDEKRVKITPKNETGSVVEIVVQYHERRPVLPGEALESNRVDIGCFVNNGTYHSPPGFVTWYTLDNEARGYDEKGRVLDIGYGVGEVDVRVSDYKVLFDGLANTELFPLTDPQRKSLEIGSQQYEIHRLLINMSQAEAKKAEDARAKVEVEWKAAQAQVEAAKKSHEAKPSEETKAALEKATKDAAQWTEKRKTATDGVQHANKETADAQKKLDGFLTEKRQDLGMSIKEFVDRRLRNAWQEHDLFGVDIKFLLGHINRAAPARRNALQDAAKRLGATGVAEIGRDGRTVIRNLIRDGNGRTADLATPFEKLALQRYNAVLLAEIILPGALTVSAPPNYVDFRLFSPKSWRDIYHYDKAGKLLGWTRRDGDKVLDFTEEGFMVTEKDAEGRPIKARSVRYQQKPPPPREPWRTSPLEMTPGEVVVTYSYQDGKRVEKSRTGQDR